MFIYLIALVATLFIIFGLLHARCLNDWLQSSIRLPFNVSSRLIRRPVNEISLQNESLENNLTSERPFLVTSEWGEHDGISVTFNNVERLPDSILDEPGIKLRNPRYNFEDIPPIEMKKDPDLAGTKTLQLGIAKNNAIGKQEANENIFESLKNSIEKTAASQSGRLNTKQIYNLIMKETMKESEAKQKLVESFRSKPIESPIEIRDHFASSSSKEEDEDNLNKSKSNDTI
nr:uncharacterized protein LOC117601915 [Osmia lignaria]